MLDWTLNKHTHTCPGARLLGANIDSEEAERPLTPLPALAQASGPELLRGLGGGGGGVVHSNLNVDFANISWRFCP